MDLEIEQQKRQEFYNILFDLAKDQTILKDNSVKKEYFIRLEDLYYDSAKNNSFRHFYSDIFSALSVIKQDTDMGDINILAQNINIIREEYIPTRKVEISNEVKYIDISENLAKLYDHINLDIQRINYREAELYKAINGSQALDVRKKLNDIQLLVDVRESEMSAIEGAIDELDEKIKKTQDKYITVLGIFSSIVLAVTAGITFSSSILENMHSVSVYRIVLITLIIGMVLINVASILIYYLKSVLRDRNNKMLTMCIVVNAIFLILIGSTIFAWSNAWVENRNEDVKEDLNNRTSAVTEAQTESTTQALETLIETTGVTVPKN